MIGFRNNKPLLIQESYIFSEYGEEWLGKALEAAARRAGTSLPFLDDLLASIRYYLENQCNLSVMSIDELFNRIRHMLNKIGLEHVARELKNEVPPVAVSVAEIAYREPFWLFFDGELRRQVSDLQDQGITNYFFTEKKECVLALQGQKRWTHSSQNLLKELDFLLSRYQENHSIPIAH